jgi:hypothetical protein
LFLHITSIHISIYKYQVFRLGLISLLIIVLWLFEPDGRRPGRDLIELGPQINMSPNGRLPATLPEPIRRARDKDMRGFAGEGNVVERSERYASVAKPEEPKDTKRRARAGLLGAGSPWPLQQTSLEPRMARAITLIFFNMNCSTTPFST